MQKNQEGGEEELPPNSKGTASEGRSGPNAPGCVYMIKMSGGSGPHTPPPLYKVGFTNDLNRRKSDLKAGNPFKLEYFQIWPVSKKSDAEVKAKRKLRSKGLNYQEKYKTGGGTEWYELPDTDNNKDPLDELVNMVRGEIMEYFDKSDESSCTHPDVSSNPNQAPNQASAVIATNYDHLNPQSAGGYIKKWRQSLSKGNVLHVKYNCK